MNFANRYYNSSDGTRKPIKIIPDIVFVRDEHEFPVVELTDEEVCVLVAIEYCDRDTLHLPCWWDLETGYIK